MGRSGSAPDVRHEDAGAAPGRSQLVHHGLDSLDMFGAAAQFPEQVETAARAAQGIGGLPARDAIDNVVVLGMGGSGIAGDVLAAIGGPFVPVPVVVTKGYAPPAFVGPGTMCFAVSFSGDTEETVQAAQTAAAAGAHMAVLARGGELAALAPTWQAPLVGLPDGIPMPRAGLGALTVPLILLLESVGLFRGATNWVSAAVAQLKRRRDALVREPSPAAEVARRIGRTIPLVSGGGPIGAAAAQRWKTQVNENAKAPAFAITIPELCHNEVCGWGQHGDVTRQMFSLVELRHDEEHPQEARRFELVRDILAEVVHDVIEIRAEGEGALAQLFDLVLFGDFVSLYLATHEGIDPGPVPVLDELKQALAG